MELFHNMTDQNIQSYVNREIFLIVPTRGRASLSIFGTLQSNLTETSEERFYWVNGNISALFYETDVRLIEVSEHKGIVIRLG